jgi:hypothetical protein
MRLDNFLVRILQLLALVVQFLLRRYGYFLRLCYSSPRLIQHSCRVIQPRVALRDAFAGTLVTDLRYRIIHISPRGEEFHPLGVVKIGLHEVNLLPVQNAIRGR